MPHIRLSHVNNILVGLIILVNLYTIAFPFLPQLWFVVQSKTDTTSKLQQQIHSKPTPQDVAGTRVIIPKMQLDETIHEVKSTKSIRNDIWRRPNTSTPDKGSNTVLVGHRFTYTNPTGVLYHLDKLAIGDEIGITWQQKRYIYRVESIKTTSPNEVDVEAPSPQPQLTLYTCTPLWNPTKRLVVIAALEKIYE
jgi:LPXTG-site transpeptidase (sortase) family protein